MGYDEWRLEVLGVAAVDCVWVGRCRSAYRSRRPVLAASPVQGVEVLGVGVGEGVEVLAIV
jgi:hypothetical protein